MRAHGQALDSCSGALAIEDASNSPKPLAVQVCNGFGNQRLAIVYAALLAKDTSRSLVLPQLIGSGTQHSFSENPGKEGELLDFGAVYNVGTFQK